MQLAELFAGWTDYSAESADWESALPAGGGVYLLADAEGRLIQLATTADLKRTLRHRLGRLDVARSVGPDETAPSPTSVSLSAQEAQPGGSVIGEGSIEEGEAPLSETSAAPVPVDAASRGRQQPSKPRINLREIVRRIWWRPARSQFELTWEYYRLARVLMPQTYRRHLAFGPCWFVHVDPAAHTPQFTPGKFLRSPPGVDLGPFATQSDAARLIEILQDTFDLCRYHHILEQAPRGQACAYFEMGKCPAPCDGSIPLSTYRDTIAEALRFACGEREPAYARLQSAMQDAAARREYERAGLLKRQLDRAKTVEHASFARVRPIDAFSYLIVQRGRGSARLKPFFVRKGPITPGAEIKRSQLSQTLPDWIRQMAEEPEAWAADSRSEQIWLVSHFLFKPDAPGAYLHASELCDVARAAAVIEERFARAGVKSEDQGVSAE